MATVFFVVDAYSQKSKPDLFYVSMREWIVTSIQKRRMRSFVSGLLCGESISYHYLICCISGVTGDYDEKGNFTFYKKVPSKFKIKIKSLQPPPLGFCRTVIAAYQYYVDSQKAEIAEIETNINLDVKPADKAYWENEIVVNNKLLRSATRTLNKLTKEQEARKKKRRLARAKLLTMAD